MRLRTVTLPALALGLALAGGPARAQEPSTNHLVAARELVLASGAANSIDRILPAIADEIRRQIVTRPELVKDLDEVLKNLQPEIEQQLQQALAIAARVYTKWLTEPEIKDAIAFFRSAAGTKFVKVQPELTDDVVNTVTAWSQLAAEYMMTRTRAEMGKRGHQMQ